MKKIVMVMLMVIMAVGIFGCEVGEDIEQVERIEKCEENGNEYDLEMDYCVKIVENVNFEYTQEFVEELVNTLYQVAWFANNDESFKIEISQDSNGNYILDINGEIWTVANIIQYTDDGSK